MAEVIRGKLVVITTKNKEDNGLRITFPTKKSGMSQPTPFKSDQLHPALNAKLIEELRNLDVDLELEGGQPRRIRPVGDPWRIPTSTASGEFFHNPYNFIPALPRPEHSELGDHPPASHDHYRENLWSGRIAVTLTTETPLLILDAARAREVEGTEGHKSYPIRLGPDGKPYLPPTSVKGMLRSAYEAVTNSRLSVFVKHSERLAYRMEARFGPVPARVENGDSGLVLRVMKESAKLQRYQTGSQLPLDKGESRAATRYEGSNQLPTHGDLVWVRINQGKIARIRKWQPECPGDGEWHKGWVCITGPNIQGKRYERVFVEDESDLYIPVTPEIQALWDELIQNYRKVHKDDIKKRLQNNHPRDYLGHEPGKTGWSRHVYEAGEIPLQAGTLCYVEFSGNRITALLPVTISRRLYDVSPEQFLDSSLKPATELAQLSPADRVFGWVNQSGNGAYRGNLRIGQVICESADSVQGLGFPGLPLAILGQPKEQQARFYAARDQQGTPLEPGLAKARGYSKRSQGLRGRKVYPHHNLPEGYWDNPLEDSAQPVGGGYFREYRRPDGPDQRDNQNRSIQGWIKPGVSFRFAIQVNNLSAVELGALLWLLELPEGHYHRLGGGKPLGFGSVRLTVNWAQSDLREGKDWQAAYCTLAAVEPPAPGAARQCMQRFEEALVQAYGSKNPTFIAAFKRCAKGFEDGNPIHYPRVRPEGQQGPVPPNPKGEGFEWFVANEKSRSPKSLPSLLEKGGLPVVP